MQNACRTASRLVELNLKETWLSFWLDTQYSAVIASFPVTLLLIWLVNNSEIEDDKHTASSTALNLK